MIGEYVKAGDVWQDTDRRNVKVRRVRVEEVRGSYAFVVGVESNRKTRIGTERLRQRYRLVERDGKPVTP